MHWYKGKGSRVKYNVKQRLRVKGLMQWSKSKGSSVKCNGTSIGKRLWVKCNETKLITQN